MRFSARIWFRRHDSRRAAQPPRPAVLALLADIEQRLRTAKQAPVALTVATFPPGSFTGHGAGQHLAVVTIEAEPGELKRPLRCWYEWQHPSWRFGDFSDARELPPPQPKSHASQPAAAFPEAAGQGGPEHRSDEGIGSGPSNPRLVSPAVSP